MLYLHQHNRGIVECKDWDEVEENLTVCVCPKEFLRAKNAINAGRDHWNFVYGFCWDQVRVQRTCAAHQFTEGS